MEQHLLPLPPIFQDTDFGDHRDDEEDYYYGDEEGDAFQWPSRFCADPLWIGQQSGAGLGSLSACFQHAILAQLAPLFLLLSLPVLCFKLANAKREQKEAVGAGAGKCWPLPFGTLAWLRYLVSIVLFALKLLLLLISAYEWLWLDQDIPLVELLYPVTQMATQTLLLHYTEQCRLTRLVVPGPIFGTWLIFALSGVPEFFNTANMGIDPKSGHFLGQLVQLAWWPLCCLQLLLHCFAGTVPPRPDDEPNSSPESRVSFLSRQFFFWFDSLVRLGHRRPINDLDVYRLEPNLRAKRLFRRWARQWEWQMDKYFDWQRHSKLAPKITITKALKKQQKKKDPERSPLLPIENANNNSYGSAKRATASAVEKAANDGGAGQALPSIVSCLWALFKWEISGAMLAKFLSDLLQFASPLLLGQLITFTEDLRVPTWWGFVLASILFLSSEMRSLLMNTYFLLMNNIGCQVQSVLTSAVYSKTLKLSSAARRSRTSGEIVNLMAIDVDRFQQVTPLLQQLWSSPLQVVIALFLLYQTIGWAVAGGVVVMLALIPSNFFVMRFTKRWQLEQMNCKDKRLRLINEVLTGIRAVKLYAWEVPMMRAIEDVRREEVQLIRRASLLRTCSDVLNMCSPFIVAIVTFAIFIYSDPVNNVLTPQVAFVSLTLFSQLRIPMLVLADLLGQLIQTAVSNRRLQHFMVADEIDPEAVQRDFNPEYERSVDVEFASFDWAPTTGGSQSLRKHSLLPPGHPHSAQHGLPLCAPYTLNNVELHIRRGLLVAIVGRVGSGKSSLLSALLGEMNKAYGYVGLRGQVAYVPQQPWILNQTVRQNILFPVDDEERPDEELYGRVVDACALRADFAVLPDGDRTEIGERGINLSGGQKARVNLARALYRQADIYLLDDPLSAVDAIVGRHLFDRAIGPESLAKGSTRLLVTHSLAYLAQCDWIVVLEDGQIKRQGTYGELLQESDVAQLIAKLEEEKEKRRRESEEEEEEEEKEAKDGNIAEGEEEADDGQSMSDAETELTLKSAISHEQEDGIPGQVRKRRTRSSRGSSKPSVPKKMSAQARKKPSAAAKLVKEEGAQTGRVKPTIYRDYFAAMRWPLFFGFIIFSSVQSGLTVSQAFWLSSWSDDNSPLASAGRPKTSLALRFGVYALQGFGVLVFMAFANVSQILGSVSASIRLHGPLLESVLHAPVSFFDTTPLGRVLNRFGKEFDTLDSRLAGALRMLMFCLLSVLTVFIQISISLPLFMALILPVGVLYVFILRYFIPTSRQLQRLTSITRSPLYNLFAETINGIGSIRAYGVAPAFFDNFAAKLDTHIGCRYFSLIANRWLSIRLELIGNIVILFCAILAVFSRDWGTVTAGLIGLAVSKSLDITFILSFLVRSLNDVELSIVSVERVLEYKDCPQEASWHSPIDEQPPAGWPQNGAVTFQHYSCRYRPELDLSLRSINAEIRPREKVGVVGRTGAGKTSMALSLFRIIEAAEGRILIDGVDIARVGLQELRSRITVIPQDPVLFSGTLRFNLDPFNIYTDAELWTVLEHVHLRAFVESHGDRLSHEIAESGENISVGQRQLLCLARAILRRSPLIVLDEATASIDSQTDTLIQRTIRTEFKHSTILTIAHRISTVMDYDRIMVMANGRLVEFDTPANLMANRQSHFHGLVSTADDITTTDQQHQGGHE